MSGCESWTIKKAECQRIDAFKLVLEKTLESPLDSKEIQPVHPKGNQPWMFTGRTDAKASALMVWPPDAKSRIIGRDPYTAKDWEQEEKGATEDGTVGWHHRLNGHEFEKTLGDGEGQGAWCASADGVTKSWRLLSNRTTIMSRRQGVNREGRWWLTGVGMEEGKGSREWNPYPGGEGRDFLCCKGALMKDVAQRKRRAGEWS